MHLSRRMTSAIGERRGLVLSADVWDCGFLPGLAQAAISCCRVPVRCEKTVPIINLYCHYVLCAILLKDYQARSKKRSCLKILIPPIMLKQSSAGLPGCRRHKGPASFKKGVAVQGYRHHHTIRSHYTGNISRTVTFT